MADGVQVAEITGRDRRWRAVLWPVAGHRPRLHRDRPKVTGRLAGDVKAALRARLETDGPWWADETEASRAA